MKMIALVHIDENPPMKIEVKDGLAEILSKDYVRAVTIENVDGTCTTFTKEEA